LAKPRLSSVTIGITEHLFSCRVRIRIL
jgi:hypothetical protein